MKSAHRHELQTNALAQRLDVAIQQTRPYVSTIAGVIFAIAVVWLIWSYMSKSSASRQGDAWSAYNQAIGATMPNLDELHRSAQEYPGTKMHELAEMTWADGQVMNAAQNYIHNRAVSKAAMDRAVSAYTGILGTSSDEALLDRAHLGLARVYEMRGDLEKAQKEYLEVRGGYAEYAKAQADRLAKPEAKDTYAWLEKAIPPRVAAGAGTPGQRPEFSAGDLTLPDATLEPGAPGVPPPATSIDDLLEGLGELPSQTGDSPESQTAPPADPTSLQEPATPPTTEPADPSTPPAPPSSDGTAPSESTAPATENDEKPPAEADGTPPATEAEDKEEKSAE